MAVRAFWLESSNYGGRQVTCFIQNFSLHSHSSSTLLRLHSHCTSAPQLYKTRVESEWGGVEVGVDVECVTPLRMCSCFIKLWNESRAGVESKWSQSRVEVEGKWSEKLCTMHVTCGPPFPYDCIIYVCNCYIRNVMTL